MDNRTQDSFNSAGILVYCIRDGKIMILLGKEKNGLYSDFGGHKKSNETSKETAIREFSEETLNFIINKSFFKEKWKCKSLYNKKHKYMCYILKINCNSVEKNIKSFNTAVSVLIRNKRMHAYNIEKIYLRWFTLKEIIDNKSIMRTDFFNTLVHICAHNLFS